MIVYHEQQSLWRCGIHAINNLLQAPLVNQAQMDAVCQVLVTRDLRTTSNWSTWLWNPHRAPLGIGNYDVNVLMMVLEQQGYSMQWMDKRQRITQDVVDFDKLQGVLCNIVVTDGICSRFVSTRHWFAIRKIDGICYNLDSKLLTPIAFNSDAQCLLFLQELVDTGECELFLITTTKP